MTAREGDVMTVIRRGTMNNCRWFDIDVRGHSLLAVTYRLARWDRKRGRYLELIVFGRTLVARHLHLGGS